MKGYSCFWILASFDPFAFFSIISYFFLSLAYIIVWSINVFSLNYNMCVYGMWDGREAECNLYVKFQFWFHRERVQHRYHTHSLYVVGDVCQISKCVATSHASSACSSEWFSIKKQNKSHKNEEEKQNKIARNNIFFVHLTITTNRQGDRKQRYSNIKFSIK